MRLGISLTTLRRWRWEGREMPRSVKLGRLLRYYKDDVDAWVRAVVSGEIKAGKRGTGHA